MTYHDLVRVPDEVDPFDAVALIRVYTSAFQTLMQGIHGHERYARKPLMNRRILIVGPCGTFERALVDLSNLLGAQRVYFSAHSSTHSHDMYIRSLGAKPLSDDPGETPNSACIINNVTWYTYGGVLQHQKKQWIVLSH